MRSLYVNLATFLTAAFLILREKPESPNQKMALFTAEIDDDIMTPFMPLWAVIDIFTVKFEHTVK